MSTLAAIRNALCSALIAAFAVASYADNGFIISTYCKSKGVGGAVGTIQRGSLVKYTLTGTSVSAPTTIFDYTQGGLANFPVISFDGTKVAFWRWGVSQTRSGDNVSWVQRPGPLSNVNYLPDTNWLSVMNVDGTGLTNLLVVDLPCIGAGEEHMSAIAWPCGDWIYYEKPTNSWEIWRVNYKNPLLNELVVRFVRDPDNIDDPTIVPYFRRFSMSADGRFAGGQLTNYTNTSFFNFPPPGGDVTDPGAHLGGTGGCNTAMSASGTRIAHYLYGNHSTTYFKTYNGLSGADDGSQNIQANSETIRWAANSDRWLTQCYSSGLSDDGYNNFANQVVRSLATSQSIYPHNNSNGWNNDAGQVWISGGPADSYMDRNGTWVTVSPTVPRDATAPSTPGSLAVQARGAHVAALTWSASTDAQSGVFCYIVYRNSTQIGTTKTLSYTDSTLTGTAQVTYGVSAINKGATESAKATVVHTSPTDAQGAQIVAIDADCGPTTVAVYFDESVDQTTAQTPGNYTITGTTVTGAVLSTDARKVTLTTGAMAGGSAHTLTVRNVLDKAGSANASTATAPFTYRGLAHGLVYETYNASCGWGDVPALTGTPAATGVVRNFDLSSRGSSCAMRFKGYLSVPTTGTYELRFCVYYSGDVYLDGVKVITFPNNFAAEKRMVTMPITAGLHTLTADIATPYGTAWLFGWYVGPDGVQHRISDDMLFHSADGSPIVKAGLMPRATERSVLALRQNAGHTTASIGAPGRYRLTVIAANGAVVRSLSGVSTKGCTVPITNLAKGMYFVRAVVQGKSSTLPMIVD